MGSIISFLTKVWSSKYRPYLLSVITLAVGVWLGTFFATPKIEYKTVTVTETVTDTVTKYIPKIEYREKIVKVPTPYIVDATPPPMEIDTLDKIRGYKGSVNFGDTNMVIHYDARVRGLLIGLRLGYEDNRPETIKYITKTVTVTETINRTPRGVYVGVMAGVPYRSHDVDFDIGPAVDVVLNKNIFSYSYQLNQGLHMVGFKRRLF